MSTIICGSKPYKNINFDKLIDDNFNNIVRCNFLTIIKGYGKKDSSLHFLNSHIKNNVENFSLKQFIHFYSPSMDNINDINYFYKYYHNTKNRIKYIYILNNNTIQVNKTLKNINSSIQLNKIARCGCGAIAYTINHNILPFLVGFGIGIDEINFSLLCNKNYVIPDCHELEKEKQIIIEFHNKNLVDATFSTMLDCNIPTLLCNLLKPKIQSIVYILKTYGICILKNYYNNDILDNLINEYHKVFEQQKSKIEILDKEDCSNDERIFHAQKYSEYIKNNFSNNELFNSIAVEYTKHPLNKKTLINKVVYEEGKIKNSGAGWHRDNHNCQFKILMYLSDVNEKNGCFQFLTNSSKKYIGYPPPRTPDYDTRYYDKTIEDIVEKNEECKIHNIIGEKGTVVIVDTTYIHRGKIIEEGERYAVTQYFIT